MSARMVRGLRALGAASVPSFILSFAGQLLCAASVLTFLLWPGAAVPAGTAAAATHAAPIGLKVTGPAYVASGQRITFAFTVINQTAHAAGLAALAAGTVTMEVRREGVRVAPAISTVDFDASLRDLIVSKDKLVPPGGSVTFSLYSQSSPDGVQTLESISADRHGEGVAADWVLNTPGRYSVSFLYAMPGGPSAVGGTSGRATVAFTYGKDCPKPSLLFFPGLPWVLGGGAAALFLLRYRRPVVKLTSLAVSVSLIGLCAPGLANATIYIWETDDLVLKREFATCEGKFAKNDPVGIMAFLNSGEHQVKLVQGHEGRDYHHGDTKGVSNVSWDLGESGELEPGVEVDRCAELYHELVHAYDQGKGLVRLETCQIYGNVTPQREVRAVRAENLYRAAAKEKLGETLHERTQWGSDYPIPEGKSIDPDQIEKDCTPPPPPPPAPAPTPSGGSTGDPHLTTFDGRKYDFQAVGEFVLAEAPGLQIQARQAPLADDPFVSVNSALAFQIGTHRLVYSQDDGLRTSLDGADAVFTDQPTRLPGGGSVVVDRYGDQTVTWPDGTRASVSAIGFWGLGLLVFPSPALKGKVAGLLGDFDGNPANDLAASGKVLLSDPPEDKQLYGVFADTWRVSAATSLLPYAAGTSTATFTDKSFPTRILTADNLSEDQRRPAQKVCAELGIAERRAQDDCVLDVARAGQPSFATGAQAAEEQIGAGTRPPAAGAVHAGGTLPDLARASDSITQGGRVDRYRLELGSATVLRLADLTGEVGTSGKATLRFDLDPPQSVDAPGFTYTAATEQWRLDPGVAYTLTVTRTDADTGPYSFVAVAAKEHKAALTFDNQASGYLDTRGRVDILTFHTSAPSRVRFKDGFSRGLSVALVEDTRQPRAYTPHALSDKDELELMAANKDYALVVWSEDERTSPYFLTPELVPEPVHG